MNREEKIIELRRMLKNLPEVMCPLKASRNIPIGKNRLYELIKTKSLRSFVYQGSYIISKDDLIEYLADHCEDESRKNYKIIKKGNHQ